jgi:hypothetical protein
MNQALYAHMNNKRKMKKKKRDKAIHRAMVLSEVAICARLCSLLVGSSMGLSFN